METKWKQNETKGNKSTVTCSIHYVLFFFFFNPCTCITTSFLITIHHALLVRADTNQRSIFKTTKPSKFLLAVFSVVAQTYFTVFGRVLSKSSFHNLPNPTELAVQRKLILLMRRHA